MDKECLGDFHFVDPFDRNSYLPSNMKNYRNSLQQVVCILTLQWSMVHHYMEILCL
jgi:hypothetical protein